MIDIRYLMNLCENIPAKIQVPLLFHCTPTTSVARIFDDGLIPNATGKWGEVKERYTSPRIFMTQDLEAARSFASGLIEYDDVESVTILAIDPSGLRLFADLNWLDQHLEFDHPLFIPVTR